MLKFTAPLPMHLGVYWGPEGAIKQLVRPAELSDVAAALSVPLEALERFLEARRDLPADKPPTHVITREVKLENKGPREPELSSAVCSKCGHRWKGVWSESLEPVRCPDCRDWTGRWLTEYDEPRDDESIVEVCNRILAEDEGYADMALTKKALRAYRRLRCLPPDPELAED